VIDFDTVSCGRSASLTVEVENIGDESVVVSEIETTTAPFTDTFETPFTLLPSEKRTFQLQYAPTYAPLLDSLRLTLRADNPVPTAIGFLFDVSDGMTELLEGDTRISAAHDASVALIEKVMSDGAPEHEGAVYAYSTSSMYRLIRSFTSEKSQVQGALPSAATGTHACAWDAMQRTITYMQTRDMRKFLIVFSGSEDAGTAMCGPYSAAGVISTAVAAQVAVYTISLGGLDEGPLRDIAEQTGGAYARISTKADLQSAMDVILHDLHYDVPQQLILRGEAVSPLLAISPGHTVFPTTAVGDTSATSFFVCNVGTAPVHLGNIEGLSPDMTLQLPGGPIAPNDSARVIALFHPYNQGYSHPVVSLAYNGCGGGLETLDLYGVGYEKENSAVGPILSISHDFIDFGNVSCASPHQRELTLRNTGDALLTLNVLGVDGERFACDEIVLQLEPSAEKILNIRFEPRSWLGKDTGALHMAAPVRTSATTMVAFDLSKAMYAPFEAPLNRVEALQLGFGDVLADLAWTASVRDSMAVISAKSGAVAITQQYCASKSLLAQIIPQAGTTDSTHFLDAVRMGLDNLMLSHHEKRLLLFTALGDADLLASSSQHFATLLERAQNHNIAVSCILLSDVPADSLQLLCENSSGVFHRANNMMNLRAGIVQFHALKLAPKHETVPLSANSVTGELSFTSDTLHFPDTRVGESSCVDVTLVNRGDGTLDIHDVDDHTFTLQTQLPVSISPHDSIQVRICFVPERPYYFRSSLRFQTNSCMPDTLWLQCEGKAWDSSSVRLAGTYLARPGGLVRVPIYMGREFTEEYSLHSLNFNIAYNPTLLYPDLDFPIEDPTGKPLLGATGYIKHDFDTTRFLATTRYQLWRGGTESTLITVGADHLLGYIRLRVYLGNSTSTSVQLLSAHTTNLNLPLSTWGEATVQLDSLPWLEERLIDPTTLYGITLGKHSPNPVQQTAAIPFRLEQAAHVRMTLHDAVGRQVRIITDAEYPAGAHRVTVHVQDLAAGVYFYRLQSGRAMESRLMPIIK
jgi:hypothetical protein